MPIFAKGELVDLDSVYINQTGDEMNGVLNMKSNKIINLPLPENSTDAVNKKYVDVRTRIYGFNFTANVNPQSTEFTIEVKVAGDVDPSKIMMSILRPALIDLVQNFSRRTTKETSCKFRLKFNKNINRQHLVYGIIFILSDPIFSISDSNSVINIDSQVSVSL